MKYMWEFAVSWMVIHENVLAYLSFNLHLAYIEFKGIMEEEKRKK